MKNIMILMMTTKQVFLGIYDLFSSRGFLSCEKSQYESDWYYDSNSLTKYNKKLFLNKLNTKSNSILI